MNENIITVTGNLCTKPELRQTRNGSTMLTFRVASTHRYFSSRTGQWEEGVSNFYDVVAYRQLAFNAGKSLSLGDAVILQGQLKQRRYERQGGGFGLGLEIEARLIGPDLAYGVATFLRAPRPQGRAQDTRLQDTRPQDNGGQQGAHPTSNGGQSADGPGADPWAQGREPKGDSQSGPTVDPHTGEVHSDEPIDPDAVGFLVDKDDDDTREFPPSLSAEPTGEDSTDGNIDEAHDGEHDEPRLGELVGASD